MMGLGGFGASRYLTASGRYNALEGFVRSIYIAFVSSAALSL
jgi:hypothetical protein